MGAVKDSEFGRVTPIPGEGTLDQLTGPSAKLDWIQEGDRGNRLRWHNLKYSWWVEQHGRTVAELDALRSQDFWAGEQAQAAEFDRRLREVRGY